MKPMTLDVNHIDAMLDKHGYIVIHDLELKSLSLAVRAEYEQCLRATKPHAPRARLDFRTLPNEPWRKLAISSRNGIGEAYAQNLQSTYFSADDKNYPALGSMFKMMIGVRNQLMRVSENFGQRPTVDLFWDACRIHHYPRGGGYMVMHKDTHFPHIVDTQIGKPFYQILVLLSRKGIDFMNGGGFVISDEDKKVDLEVEGGFGSLVIFDGRTAHGVDDVDPDQIIDFSKLDGRLAAFVSLYSVPSQ